MRAAELRRFLGLPLGHAGPGGPNMVRVGNGRETIAVAGSFLPFFLSLVLVVQVVRVEEKDIGGGTKIHSPKKFWSAQTARPTRTAKKKSGTINSLPLRNRTNRGFACPGWAAACENGHWIVIEGVNAAGKPLSTVAGGA